MTNTKNTVIAVVPLRDMAPQPGTTVPMYVGREKSKNAVRAATAGKTPIILVSQKTIAVENPQPEDVYGVGILGELNQVIEHPDGTIRIVVTSKSRGYLRNVHIAAPTQDSQHLAASFEEIIPEPASADVAKAAKSTAKSFGTYCKLREDEMLAESRQLLGRINELQNQIQALRAASESVGKLTDPNSLADLIPGCINMQIKPEKLGDPETVKTLDARIRAKQAILSEPDPAKRLQLLRKFIEDEPGR